MNPTAIDLPPLRKSLGCLAEALMLWHEQPTGTVSKLHLRSAVLLPFAFSHELSVRSLRRVLVERAASVERVASVFGQPLATRCRRWPAVRFGRLAHRA